MMRREQCDFVWPFKIGQKSLVIVFGGLIVTTVSTVTVPSLAIEQIPSIAQANASAEAQLLRQQGSQLVKEGGEDSLRQAVLLFEKARNLSLSVNDINFEFSDSVQLGLIYERLGDKQEALKFFNQALIASTRKHFRDVYPNRSRMDEAFARASIGRIYDDSLCQEQQALEFYNQALAILSEQEIVKEHPEESRKLETNVLYNRSMIHERLDKMQQSLEFLNQLFPLSFKASDPIDRAIKLNNVGVVLSRQGKSPNALALYCKALEISREEDVRKVFINKSFYIEALTLKNIGDIYSNLGKNQQALEMYDQALVGYQNKKVRDELPKESIAGESDTYNQIGLIYDRLNRIELALEAFEKSLALSQELGEFESQVITLQNIGKFYTRSNRRQEAWIAYEKSLETARNAIFRKKLPLDSLKSEMVALKNMGDFQQIEGEYQRALDFFKIALEIATSKGFREAFPSESRKWVAIISNDIGLVYDDVEQQQKSLVFYESALAILKEQIIREAFPLESRLLEIKVRNNIGTVSRKLCFTSRPLNQIKDCYENQVLGNFKKTWEISRERELQQAFPRESLEAETSALNNMADSFRFLGLAQEALNIYSLALPLVRKLGDRLLEAQILNGKAVIHAHANNLREDLLARDSYREALNLIQTVGDRNSEAKIRSNLAVLYERQGNLSNALAEVSTAISLIENLRGNFRNHDLKISYFSGMQGIYQQKIDLLMQLHEKEPQKGYDKQALETSDRARARSLIELLTESRIDIREGISEDLLKREKELQQKRDAVEMRRIQLVSSSAAQAQVERVQQDIEALQRSQETLKDEIRRTSPAYTNLKYPAPLKFADIQKQLDADTVLLQYSLGEERSYLWVVGNTGVPKSYPLPSREKIETEANKFLSGVKATEGSINDVLEPGRRLNRAIKLNEIKPLLQGKRIVIAADGVLHQIPFAALPNPNTPTQYQPLMLEHEIVNVPSMSAVATLRQTSKRPPAPKLFAAVADPVFRADDPRVTGRDRPIPCAKVPFVANAAATPPSAFALELQNLVLERSSRNTDWKYERLPNTRRETERILSLMPPDQRMAVCDFEANPDWVKQAPLDDYRYLLFATHGAIDLTRPADSGLVLSLVDQRGEPRLGRLNLGDIFNLRLNSELVVLSACETGRGKEIRGEGIIGLTRGFMYAGAKRVVVSLWNVNDAKTADLMEDFHRQVIQDKIPPARALRMAQRHLWQTSQGTGFAHPRYWAAFTLQGEWR